MLVVDIDPESVGEGSALQERATALAAEGHFLGGPPQVFHSNGCNQLVTLLECGLLPAHNVLDIGCGCLRGGYWMIHFLDRDRYCGIEPNVPLLEFGRQEILPDTLAELKQPKFDTNSDFNFSLFDRKFDFMIARSVWTHAAPAQIEKMLDNFLASSTPEAVFLVSYIKAASREQQYSGKIWGGRVGSPPVRYTAEWIEETAQARGLVATELRKQMANQRWVRIQRRAPAERWRRSLKSAGEEVSGEIS